MLKKFSPLLVLILLSLLVWFVVRSGRPTNVSAQNIPLTEFSTQRAFKQVENLSKAPHYVGSPEHSLVRNYIIDELQKLGLEVQTQEGYTVNKKGEMSLPQNILARIPGTGNGQALVLMTHYDSAGHSSPGASDAASGAATILEGIRAFLENGTPHKNDIIILITDAEELGLNGAELFIKEHPWAKDAALALNFEARGSGGNSFMLLETNAGNAELIKHFIKAKPDYPVTNSLAYSVYKMLPNDTDLTVLREQGNMNGFNFAFIDDHYDYHTANDTPENLDLETLAHQGSYLMPLLNYFKDADLTKLNSEEDLIYFSLPMGEMQSYPFSWIIPMLLIGMLAFAVLVLYGLKKKKLHFKMIFKGALPYLISLIGAGVLIYLLKEFIFMIYPEYLEIEHGFTYNGYYYIAAVIFLTLCVCFVTYHQFKTKGEQAGAFVFPLFFWLLICALTAFFLKGASYFIIPFYFGLIQLWVMIRQRRPNLLLMLLLSVPAVVLLLPFIVSFPVALGLKILFVTAILTVLLFTLLLPIFSYFKRNKGLGLLCFVIFNVLFFIAHFKSDFTEERQKPNSLVYLYNADKDKALWYTYDKKLDPWTQKYFGEEPIENTGKENDFSSKYASGFTYMANAREIDIKKPGINYERLQGEDSLSKSTRYSLKIAPNRNVNRMELFVDSAIDFEDFLVNDKKADSIYFGSAPFHIFSTRWNDRLLTYHAANRDTLRLEFSVQGKTPPDIVLYESSYDLLENKFLNVPQREKDMMPRPFVLNDAVILKKTIKFEP